MTAVSSFWQMVVLPTLGFGAMIGWSELSGTPISSPTCTEALSSMAGKSDWDMDSLFKLLPDLAEATEQPVPVGAPEKLPTRHRDVSWPLR